MTPTAKCAMMSLGSTSYPKSGQLVMVDIIAATSILVIAATVVAACLREERRP